MPELTPCPPWLLENWRTVYKQLENDQLPHALLMCGVAGMGKRLFAQFLAESLLCKSVTREHGACGACSSCRQLVAESHTDFRKLIPEGKSLSIKVDVVRELVNWLQLTAQQDSYKIALLESVDTMNRNAANSILKTLEEPGQRMILLLVADRVGVLPATVISRCQTMTLRLNDRRAAQQWLAETGGVSDPEAALANCDAPLYALEQQQSAWQEVHTLLLKAWQDLFLHRASVGRIVHSLTALSTDRCLKTFIHWSVLAAKQSSGIPAGTDSATCELILSVQPRLQPEQWFTLYDRLLQLHQSNSASFKTQTVLEGLFADIRLMIKG